MGRFILGLVAAMAASAQIRDLAPTDDGKHLYFSTPMRLKGTEDYTSAKIMRHLDGRFELFRQVRCVTDPFFSTNHCQLGKPQVRGDGQVVAYTATGTCTGGSRCIPYIPHSGEVVGAGLPAAVTLNNGSIRMSPNGRFIARLGGNSFAPIPPAAFIDLANATQTALPGFIMIGDGKQSLANDGTLLSSVEGEVTLWNGGRSERPRLSGPVSAARLSADARVILYETPVANGCRVYAYDVASARESFLADVALSCHDRLPGTGLSLSLSRDGSLALYRAAASPGEAPQAVLQPTNGGAPRVLTQEAAGIAEAVIAGNGEVAFAATRWGGLLRIDIRSGEVLELAKPAPQIRLRSSAFAPGSRVEIAREGLEPAGEEPALFVDDQRAPLLAEFEETLVYQIPFETDPGNPAHLTMPSESVFEQGLEVAIEQGTPGFYYLGGPGPGAAYPVAAHQDFSALVTQENPARRGEIVHLYLTGLGRVTPPIGTGELPPIEPLRRIEISLECSAFWSGTYVPVEVLFAGLAPGFTGVYQLDLRLPENAAPPELGLQCRTPAGSGWLYGFATLPMKP